MEEQSRTYILEASDLSVSFETDAGEVQAVRDVSLSLKEGEVLAIVGESGCGKSVLCKSLMKMLPGNARIKSGKILANGMLQMYRLSLCRVFLHLMVFLLMLEFRLRIGIMPLRFMLSQDIHKQTRNKSQIMQNWQS